jgi:uncharacterized protein YdaU (DUF1376 family)
MKAPWFPFYTGDFLASPDVQLMDAATVGAYTLLLAFSWQSDTPGYIEDDEYTMRRVSRLTAAEWELSKKVLLKKWPLAAEAAGLRYNPRLLKEAAKQVELRGKKAEAGQKSAELKAARKAEAERLATERQQKANTIPTPVEVAATDVPQNGNYSQPQPQSTKVDEEREQIPAASTALPAEKEKPAPNPARDMALVTTDPLDEQPIEASPMVKPRPFQAICDRNNFVGIDYEHYRKQAYAAGVRQKAKPRTASQWESWIVKYLNNQGNPASLVRPGIGPLASPDPEADRLRQVAAQPMVEQPTSSYVPFVRPPNRPSGTEEPLVSYGPISTNRGF